MTDWHGWSRGDDRRALHIGELPGRKQVCLYEVDVTVIRTLAFFPTREKAQRALALIDHLVNTKDAQ